ncbi:MAG: hypothetical protein ACUVV4_08770 [Candidatus Bathyarchaeia archaeon]
MSRRTPETRKIAFELIEHTQNQFKKMRNAKTGDQKSQEPRSKSEMFEPSLGFYKVFGRIIGEMGQTSEKDDDTKPHAKTKFKPWNKDLNNKPSNSSFVKNQNNIDSKSHVSVFEKLSHGSRG